MSKLSGCECSGKLVAWLDDELATAEAADLERHMEGCAECRRCVAAYREINGTIADFCDEYCEAEMASAGRTRVASWAPVLAAAAAVAVFFLLISHGWLQRRFAGGAVTANASPVLAPQALAQSNEGQREKRTAVEMPSAPRQKRVPPSHEVALGGASRETAPASQMGSGNRDVDRAQNMNWAPEPAVQIGIPAEAMFAPGAVPQGVSFSAELRLAADGSAHELRLQP
jgi:hypothetical protein